jgi:hypothetical protein
VLTAQKNIVDRVAHSEKSVLVAWWNSVRGGSATELSARQLAMSAGGAFNALAIVLRLGLALDLTRKQIIEYDAAQGDFSHAAER